MMPQAKGLSPEGLSNGALCLEAWGWCGWLMHAGTSHGCVVGGGGGGGGARASRSLGRCPVLRKAWGWWWCWVTCARMLRCNGGVSVLWSQALVLGAGNPMGGIQPGWGQASDACIYFRRLCLLIGHRCSLRASKHKLQLPKNRILQAHNRILQAHNRSGQRLTSYATDSSDCFVLPGCWALADVTSQQTMRMAHSLLSYATVTESVMTQLSSLLTRPKN